MGMAASQVRLLQLTSRKNTIGRELESLSLQKNSLSRDMRRVSQNYQDALSSKTLKFTTNSGVSTIDLSYANMMRPSAMNQNNPYLLTNSRGQVLVDSNYLEYAEMISPDGAPNGDYKSNRSEILSELTGIPAEKIEKSEATKAAKKASGEKIKALQKEVHELKEDCTKKFSQKDILTCMDSIYGFCYDKYGDKSVGNNPYYDYYEYNNPSVPNGSGAYRIGSTPEEAKQGLKELTNQLANNLQNDLFDNDFEKFKQACTSVCNIWNSFIDNAETDSFYKGVQVSKESNIQNNYAINLKQFVEDLLSEYRNAGGTNQQSTHDSNTFTYEGTNKDSEEYKAYAAKKAELDAAIEEDAKIVDEDNQSLTAAEESQINFYDQLFTAIAERGWAGDSQLEDNDYLNQMLQNNMYYITTMNAKTDDDGKEYYEYDESIASNLDYIVSVNDTDAINEAQVQYEYEKSIINEKETRIDTRMQNLETEQSAISQMIQGIEKVENDNIERHLNIFS